MQITLSQTLFRLQHSAAGSQIFKTFIKIYSFDPLDFGEQIMGFLSLNPDVEPYSDNFETMGYET